MGLLVLMMMCHARAITCCAIQPTHDVKCIPAELKTTSSLNANKNKSKNNNLTDTTHLKKSSISSLEDRLSEKSDSNSNFSTNPLI